jgi:hypothetical protein
MKAIQLNPFQLIPTFLSLILLWYGQESLCQTQLWTQQDHVKIHARGTGNTTGHIGFLSIENKSKSEIHLNIPTLLIPSNGKEQPYVVPDPVQASIPPKSTVEVPLSGYCVDVKRPPVADGAKMSPVDSWIVKDPDMFDENGLIPDKLYDFWRIGTPGEDGKPPTHPVVKFIDFKDFDNHAVVVNHLPLDHPLYRIPAADTGQGMPGITQAVVIHKDSIRYSAPLIFDAINKISITTDSLQKSGNMVTPFSTNQPKEREAVIQQSFWIYTSILSDDRYEKEDFQSKMDSQLEETTKMSKEKLPEAVVESFNAGVDDFWNTFNLVGTEAKVINTNLHLGPAAERAFDAVINVETPSNKQFTPHVKDLEDQLGHDISGVKVHSDEAAGATDSLKSSAVSGGADIVMKDPIFPSDELIGHELVHNDKVRKDLVHQSSTPPMVTQDEAAKVAAGNQYTQNAEEIEEEFHQDCVCDSISYVVKLFRGTLNRKNELEKQEEVETKYFKSNFEAVDINNQTVFKLDPMLKEDESFRLHFRALDVHCQCKSSSESESSKCEFYSSKNLRTASYQSRVGVKFKKTHGTRRVFDISKKDQNYHDFTFTPDPKSSDKFIEIEFDITAFCHSQKCATAGRRNTVECVEKFRIKIENK